MMSCSSSFQNLVGWRGRKPRGKGIGWGKGDEMEHSYSLLVWAGERKANCEWWMDRLLNTRPGNRVKRIRGKECRLCSEYLPISWLWWHGLRMGLRSFWHTFHLMALGMFMAILNWSENRVKTQMSTRVICQQQRSKLGQLGHLTCSKIIANVHPRWLKENIICKMMFLAWCIICTKFHMHSGFDVSLSSR